MLDVSPYIDSGQLIWHTETHGGESLNGGVEGVGGGRWASAKALLLDPALECKQLAHGAAGQLWSAPDVS